MIKKIIITILITITVGLLLNSQVEAVEKTKWCESAKGYIPADHICLNISVGGLSHIDLKDNPLGTYVDVWYRFVIGSVGILATVMIMWAGFKWLTSRGNAGTIGESKEIIWSAITGLLLAFLSFTILSLINPELLKIGLPDLGELKIASQDTCCVVSNGSTNKTECFNVDKEECGKIKGIFNNEKGCLDIVECPQSIKSCCYFEYESANLLHSYELTIRTCVDLKESACKKTDSTKKIELFYTQWPTKDSQTKYAQYIDQKGQMYLFPDPYSKDKAENKKEIDLKNINFFDTKACVPQVQETRDGNLTLGICVNKN